jgi:hypothetical protein
VPFFANAALGYFGQGSKFAAADLSRVMHVFTKGVGGHVTNYAAVDLDMISRQGRSDAWKRSIRVSATSAAGWTWSGASSSHDACQRVGG